MVFGGMGALILITIIVAIAVATSGRGDKPEEISNNFKG